jgi:DUF1009 family protein
MPRRLAVVAGAGALAPQVIEAAIATGDTVRAFVLAPQDLPLQAERETVSLQHLEALFGAIRAFGATHLTLAGAVTLDDADRKRLLVVLGGAGGASGDAALSNLALRLQQLTGATLLGPHEVASDLLAPEGHIAGPVTQPEHLVAARLAMRAARQVGAMDLGQAAVVAGGRVVAVEDVAGTDELLARVAKYRSAGLIDRSGSIPVVLAKACKPQQPLFVDLPAIGPRTVTGAAAAGISLVAVEAGRSLLVDRARLFSAARDQAVSIVGLSADG